MGCASRCPGPPPVGRAMPGPASQVLHSHEVVAICCSVLAWQIATTFLKYRPGNGRDLPLCSSVANHDHFFGLFKRKMVAKCHVCTEWHFATSPRDQPTRPAHATSPRDQPTRPAHATSPRDQPTRPAHATSPRDQPTRPAHATSPRDQPTGPACRGDGPCSRAYLLFVAVFRHLHHERRRHGNDDRGEHVGHAEGPRPDQVDADAGDED